jgi:hypothetical protein
MIIAYLTVSVGIGKKICPTIATSRVIPPLQTLKDWEGQQDDSFQQVVRQLKDLEKRIRASNLAQNRSKAP